MKVLFIADIHIKEKHKNVPHEWLEMRWQMFLDKLQELQAHADQLILGGDIFDTAHPTPIETRRYFELIQSCKLPTIIIPGNHEQKTKKYNILSDYIASTSAISPNVRVVTDPCTIAGIDYLPYQYIATPNKQASILVTHVRGEIPPHVKPEVDLELYSDYEVVLAGDLHAHSNSQLNILYPGSPYTTSFHRSITKNENGAIILDTETYAYEFIDLELPQLIKKTISNESEIYQEDFHYILWEVEGDMETVAKLKGENISKKPKAKATKATIDLTSATSVKEELVAYLTEGVKLQQQDIDRVVTRHAEYTKTNS